MKAYGDFTKAMAVLLMGAGAIRAQTYTKPFDNLTFNRPLWLEEHATKPGHMMVLEQAGTIQVVSQVNGAWTKSEFVKVTVTGGTAGADEQGLLGFTFHPQFATNRKYYVYFVANTADSGRCDIIEERQADTTFLKDAGVAPKTILRIKDPYDNHNGGTIRFGKDGYLYLGIGDGGSLRDPKGNGQNKDVLFAKLLRIDVNTQQGGKNYGIPSDNPWAAGGGAPETYAWGLRNPFRWSFDPVTNDLWVGDVGESTWEEVNIVKKGANYGWSASEGAQNLAAGITGPVFLYPHSKTDTTRYGLSVIGGYVFRGNPASQYYGKFIAADYGSGLVWALTKTSDTSVTAVNLAKAPGEPRGWGIDKAGNLYMMIGTNSIYRLTGPDFDAASTTFLPRQGNLARSIGCIFSCKPGSKLDLKAFGADERLDIFGMDGGRLGRVDRSGVVPGLQKGMYILKSAAGAKPNLLLIQ